MQLRMACNGIVDTIGRVSFGGKIAHPFTAHPKVDPLTGADPQRQCLLCDSPADPCEPTLWSCCDLRYLMASQALYTAHQPCLTGKIVTYMLAALLAPDPDTVSLTRAGEMFYIGYQMDAKPPKYWYGGVDPEGAHQFEVSVELKEGVMMHDMAITQDHAIILDTPLVFKPEAQRPAPAERRPGQMCHACVLCTM